MPAFLAAQTGCPAFVILPPAAAVVPEDEGIAIGGVVVRCPFDETIENLLIAGVGVAEGLDAVCFEAAALGDPETTGEIVLDPVELDEDVDVLRGSRPGHLFDVPECRPVEVVVPGHVNQKRPFGLAGCPASCHAARAVSCLFHVRLRF